MKKLALYATVLFSLALLIYSLASNDSLCEAPTGYDCGISIHIERFILVGIVTISSIIIATFPQNRQ